MMTQSIYLMKDLEEIKLNLEKTDKKMEICALSEGGLDF